MRWIGLIVALTLFTGVTGWAFVASVQGWGLSGLLDRPVSVRQESARGGYRRHGGAFIYFGGRRHYGGGFGHGK